MKRPVSLAAAFLIALLSVFVMPAASPAGSELVLGLPSYVSATQLHERFGPLAAHLGRELNMRVRIKSEESYANHMTNLKNGHVDIAFMGPALYVMYTKRYGAVPLLAEFESNGSRSYRGHIIVRAESGITGLSQLKGKSFAFSDRMSTMGHIVPRYLMLEAGIDTARLATHKFLDNQENVALGVLAGKFDAGAVREDIFRKYAGEGLRSIAASRPLPDHVFVARAGLPKETLRRVTDVLLSLKDSPEGRRVLEAMQKNVTALVPIADPEFDPLRRIFDRLDAAGVRL